MSDKTNISLVNLGELAKPASTLITKISAAIGGLFAPYQIARLAKAEAEAAFVRADAELRITEMQKRAATRLLQEEARKQENMEDITRQAVQQLSDGSKAEDMDNDWIVNFFEKSRLISDREMQAIWARVLAGEANAPGTFSKRTVNALGSIDKVDAEMFATLCNFIWQIEESTLVPLVFDWDEKFYQERDVTFDMLVHLDSIGLIQFSGESRYCKMQLPKQIMAQHGECVLTLEMPMNSDNHLVTGCVLLTRTGRELASICDWQAVDGLVDHAKHRWKTDGVAIVNETVARCGDKNDAERNK